MHVHMHVPTIAPTMCLCPRARKGYALKVAVATPMMNEKRAQSIPYDHTRAGQRRPHVHLYFRTHI